MAKMHLRLALVVALTGLSVLGPAGAAHASRATTVLSDSVRFSGPGRIQGTTRVFKSSSCSLTSDGESTPFVCQVSGQFVPVNGVDVGNATLTSKDGTTTWKFTLTPTSQTTATMKGNGTEADTPEAGKVSPKYPATMHGNWVASSTATGTALSGTIVVSESSTSP